MGAANVIAGFFQGFAISSSGSRTAVAEQSGAKSQVTGLVGAAIVALLLLFFNSLLSSLPQSALAAVVIAAALSLMNWAVLARYWRVRKTALALSLVATFGVVLFGVLEGIVIAIILAVLLFFRRSWFPHGTVLGRVAGVEGWHSLEEYPDAMQLPDIVVYRWEAPLFFANANAFRGEIRRLVRERHPAWVVLQCEAITDIDVTASGMLVQLDEELNAAGIHLAFVEMRKRLQDLTSRYGLFETLDRDHFYRTLGAALTEIEASATDPGAPLSPSSASANSSDTNE
jgi:MFS superfamily sulfate permease-like transporter